MSALEEMLVGAKFDADATGVAVIIQGVWLGEMGVAVTIHGVCVGGIRVGLETHPIRTIVKMASAVAFFIRLPPSGK